MIPITDSVRSRSTPYVNLSIIVVNTLVFLYEVYLSNDAIRGNITELDRFIAHWGNVPVCTLAEFGRESLAVESAECAVQPNPRWTPITAMFMHGGWLHLLGNMLFLWIFGDNIEDALGHVRYLAFYLLTGIAASATHMLFNADSLTPAIGASGAVAGVMGAYIVLFPRAIVVAFVVILIPLPVPAFVLIGFWFVMQLFYSVASLGVDANTGSGIAYLAHVGGFVAGAAIIKVFMLGRVRNAPARHVRGQRYG